MTLRCETVNLPPDQRKQLHPDFLANEQAYLRMRTALLATHPGMWVAVDDDQVIASGNDLRAVVEAAATRGGHAYIARVGAENETVFRIRRVVFDYSQSYQPIALPRVAVTFSDHGRTHSQLFTDVIPDTGADLCVLPQADCKAIDLFGSPYLTGVASGVTGQSATTLIYSGKAEIDGHIVSAVIQTFAGIQERILGRDVLNQHRVIFDGPGQQVIFEP